MDAMADEWDPIKRMGFWYSKRNEAFNSYHRSSFVETQFISLNTAASTSSSPRNLKTRLTLHIKDLQRDQDNEEGIKLLNGRT